MYGENIMRVRMRLVDESYIEHLLEVLLECNIAMNFENGMLWVMAHLLWFYSEETLL